MPAITAQDVATFRAQHQHLRQVLPVRKPGLSMPDVWQPTLLRLKDDRTPLPLRRTFIAKLAQGGRSWRFAPHMLPRTAPHLHDYELSRQFRDVTQATGLRATTGAGAAHALYGMSWLYLPGDDLSDSELQQHQLFPSLLYTTTKYGHLADLCATFVAEAKTFMRPTP
jgi:hypothetical protein